MICFWPKHRFIYVNLTFEELTHFTSFDVNIKKKASEN